MQKWIERGKTQKWTEREKKRSSETIEMKFWNSAIECLLER
jgi:hypothetical protein